MKAFLLSLALLLSQAVHADCTFSGQQYPEGTIINGYVCNEDGKWVNNYE